MAKNIQWLYGSLSSSLLSTFVVQLTSILLHNNSLFTGLDGKPLVSFGANFKTHFSLSLFLWKRLKVTRCTLPLIFMTFIIILPRVFGHFLHHVIFNFSGNSASVSLSVCLPLLVLENCVI